MSFWVGQAKAYDASGTDSLVCKGYRGLVSDGVYIYYAPYYDGSDYHGRVLRQKIMAVFTETGTWEAYNAGSTDSLTCTGYSGAVFDGRYIYFVPDYNGSYHGVVLRYDTTRPFKEAGSWDAYNAASIDSLDCKGFSGAVFDGQFVYFVPDADGAYNAVLRYDITRPFKSADSWDAYGIGSMASGKAKGYYGGVFLAGFVYLSPHLYSASPASAGFHGNIVRLDTSKPFKAASAWETFDATAVNAECKRMGRPCTDGKYIYFAEDFYGVLLRYDADKPFDSSGSYACFDIGTMIENPSCRCACVQGDYLIFAGQYSDIAVYNRNGPFGSASSWALKQCRVSRTTIGGYKGCIADPNYVYLSPYYWGDAYHGNVGRIRALPCPGSSAPQPGEAEDLNEYAIEGVSTNSSRCTASGIEMDDNASCYFDYGFEFFNEIEVNFEVQLNSVITGAPMGSTPVSVDIYLLSLGKSYSVRPHDSLTTDDISVTFYLQFNSDGDVISRTLRIVTGNGNSASSGYSISEDTTYYCTLTRSSTTLTLKIYSDAARTNLLATKTLTIGTQKWRFVYATRGHDDTDMESMTLSWWVQNIEITDW